MSRPSAESGEGGVNCQRFVEDVGDESEIDIVRLRGCGPISTTEGNVAGPV